MNDAVSSLPVLVVLTGPETGRRIPLTTGHKAVLGRSLEADLTFPDEPSLSRFHARIERHNDVYTITDLGSVNGTLINGKDIKQQEPVILSHRDVITCGELELRFELPQGQRTAAGSYTMALSRPEDEASLPRIRAILATENRPLERPAERAEMAETEAGTGETVAAEAVTAMPTTMEAEATAPRSEPTAVAEQTSDLEEIATAEAMTPESARTEQAAIESPAAPAMEEAPAASAAGVIEEVPAATPPSPEPTVPGPEMQEGQAAVPPLEPAAPTVHLPLEQAIAGLPLFRHLNEDERRALAQTMVQRHFPAGAEIVRQGEEGLSLYILLEGEVRVQRIGTHGETELATIGPGGFFGEMTLLDGEPRSATVRAITPVSCALLPRWGLEATIRANPAVAMEMLAVLSRRLRATEGLLTA